MRYVVTINEDILLNSCIDTWIPEAYEILQDIVDGEKEKGMLIPPNAITVVEDED